MKDGAGAGGYRYVLRGVDCRCDERSWSRDCTGGIRGTGLQCVS
jgi:hypothetical protein